MRIAIIGRTEILYETACLLHASGHEIVCILTSKEAPEYTRKVIDFELLASTWDIPLRKALRFWSTPNFLVQHLRIVVGINYIRVVPQSVVDLFPYGI